MLKVIFSTDLDLLMLHDNDFPHETVNTKEIPILPISFTYFFNHLRSFLIDKFLFFSVAANRWLIVSPLGQ